MAACEAAHAKGWCRVLTPAPLAPRTASSLPIAGEGATRGEEVRAGRPFAEGAERFRTASWREVRGWVHSVDTGGMVDGPGVRYVVFTSGCPLRCQFCHNPDSQQRQNGTERSAGEVIDEVARYAPFLQGAGGGLTISGGEPCAQPRFTTALLQGAKSLGLHTTLDTSGIAGRRVSPALLDAADLVLLDVKSGDPETYRWVTGVPLEPTLAFARLLDELGKPVWIRFVLVPYLTDKRANVEALARFVATLGNVRRVEILPFHKLGEYKWDALGKPYTLRSVPGATAEDVERARGIFAEYGVTAL
jgi:pyruvate formate lyase activating enzyme